MFTFPLLLEMNVLHAYQPASSVIFLLPDHLWVSQLATASGNTGRYSAQVPATNNISEILVFVVFIR